MRYQRIVPTAQEKWDQAQGIVFGVRNERNALNEGLRRRGEPSVGREPCTRDGYMKSNDNLYLAKGAVSELFCFHRFPPSSHGRFLRRISVKWASPTLLRLLPLTYSSPLPKGSNSNRLPLQPKTHSSTELSNPTSPPSLSSPSSTLDGGKNQAAASL